MRYGTRIVVAGCLVVLAASCGGDETSEDETSEDETSDVADSLGVAPEQTTAAPDAPTSARGVCSLATDAEITDIVANPVTGFDIDATLCEYSLDSGVPGADGTTVDVVVTEAFDEVCSLEFGVTGATNATVVDDVGSNAAWKASDLTPQLFICTGSSFVTITQYRPSSVADDEALARAEAIADIVLSGL